MMEQVSGTTKFVVRTALMLAVTIIFMCLKLILPFIPQTVSVYVIGSLVNASLLVTAAWVGTVSGVIVSVLAPVVAFLVGQMPTPILIPFVAIGNIIIVVVFMMFYKRKRSMLMFIAPVLKGAFLWIGVSICMAGALNLPDTAAAVITFNYSWPQIVTGPVSYTHLRAHET